jgi:non-specific serine/threonine protein kinase
LNPDEIACPICGETIRAVARKCKHCDEWLSPAPAPPPAAHPESTAVVALRAPPGSIDPAEVPGLLARLVERSLVLFEEETGRYRLLETVRQYAREKLSAGPEGDALLRQHRDHYVFLVQEARGYLEGPQEQQWLDRLALEHQNVRAALGWCELDEGSGPAGLHQVGSLQRFWDVRGHFLEGAESYRAALAHSGGQERTRERARALHGAGLMAYRQADYGTAHALYEEALSIRLEMADRTGAASS